MINQPLHIAHSKVLGWEAARGVQEVQAEEILLAARQVSHRQVERGELSVDHAVLDGDLVERSVRGESFVANIRKCRNFSASTLTCSTLSFDLIVPCPPMIQALKKFKDEHGHCDIPHDHPDFG